MLPMTSRVIARRCLQPRPARACFGRQQRHVAGIALSDFLVPPPSSSVLHRRRHAGVSLWRCLPTGTLGVSAPLLGPRALSSSSSSSFASSKTTSPPEEKKKKESESDEAVRTIYESAQGIKFRIISVFGSMYTVSWIGYVAADAYYLNPEGAIASNAGLVGLIGATSLVVGTYVVVTLSQKTVGRLELVSSSKNSSRAEWLRVTTYSPIGNERTRDVPLDDVLPMTEPDDKSRLRCFTVPEEGDRVYLVMLESDDDVKDPAALDDIVFPMRRRAYSRGMNTGGATTTTTSDAAAPPAHRRRRRSRRRA